MRLHKLLDNSLRILLMIAFGSTLILSGCNINVRKRGEGQDKKVDIETPVGGLHIRKDADARDVGVPIYPGARRKEKDEGDNDNNASVNISSSLFGLRVAAIEYLSDDPPGKLIAYYKDQLKKYGDVLECHSDKPHAGATMNPGADDSKESKRLKCEGDNTGKTTELKAGTEQNQHIVSVRPQDSGHGSDFSLVYVQVRGEKETI